MRKVLLLSVLIVLLSAVLAGRANVCITFGCGTCCSRDTWPCCDRQFELNKLSGMYGATTLAYENPEEEAIETLGLLDQSEEASTLLVRPSLVQLGSTVTVPLHQFPKDYIFYAVETLYPLPTTSCELECVNIYKIYQEHIRKSVYGQLNCLELVKPRDSIREKSISHSWMTLDANGFRCYNTSDLIYTTERRQQMDTLTQAAQACNLALYVTCAGLTNPPPPSYNTKQIPPLTLPLAPKAPLDSEALMRKISAEATPGGKLLPVGNYMDSSVRNKYLGIIQPGGPIQDVQKSLLMPEFDAPVRR